MKRRFKNNWNQLETPIKPC